MMKQTDIKFPQIRIRGYDEKWEDKSIGTILSEVKRSIILEDDQQYELITVKRRNGGVVSRGHLFGRDILVKNYSQLQAGDFIISKRQVVHGATGIIPAELDNAIVSNEYLVAVGNGEISTKFLAIISSLPDMKRKFFLSSYGVDIEKLFFDAEDWKKRTIALPNIHEQNQICAFFKKLDRIIGLHQRKHDKLLALKKAMLQKMLPQDGASIPQVRFKGFEKDWVEKKLGDIGLFYRGISYNSSNVCNSGLLVLRSSNIQNSKLILNSDLQFIDIKCPEEIMLRKGDIAICMSNGSKALVGKSAICNINPANPTTVGAFCSIFRSENAISSYLLQTATYSKYLRELLAGSSINNLKNSDLCGLIFRIPAEHAEQQKIGTYFCKLDEVVSKHAIQLEKLKQIKSACLAKMFI